jgi:hypothetical protein
VPRDELAAGLLGTVDPLPTLQGLTVTGGRLNLNGAVRSIVAQPDFRMDLASPASRSVTLGASATYAFTVTGANSFSELVGMSVLGLPAGATALFTPNTIATSGTSALDVATSAATPTGSYLLTITGSSGGRIHTMTVTLVVVGPAAVTLHLDRHPDGRLILTDSPPVAGVAMYTDSSPLSRSKGNPWRPIGTWQTMAGTFEHPLAEIHDLEVWSGLRNSDDQGATFDLRAEVRIGGAVDASGEANCVRELTRSPARAQVVTIKLGLQTPPDSVKGDLALTISARIGTGACSGHASATGLRLYYGSGLRDSHLGVGFATPP